MAILVEGISVVARLSAIHERYPGGWTSYEAVAPNTTICADNELSRIGFMMPQDAEAFVNKLAQYDILYVVDGKARDVVIVDQLRGPLTVCDWIQFGHINLGGNSSKRVAACMLAGSTQERVFTPLGWQFERSLSSQFGFVPESAINKSLRFLRHDDGVDIYLNELTGKEVYVGRTS